MLSKWNLGNGPAFMFQDTQRTWSVSRERAWERQRQRKKVHTHKGKSNLNEKSHSIHVFAADSAIIIPRKYLEKTAAAATATTVE